jgi:hypothetical protein
MNKNHQLQIFCRYAQADDGHQELNNTPYQDLVNEGFDISVGDYNTA